VATTQAVTNVSYPVKKYPPRKITAGEIYACGSSSQHHRMFPARENFSLPGLS